MAYCTVYLKINCEGGLKMPIIKYLLQILLLPLLMQPF